jgi:hypothetical protein
MSEPSVTASDPALHVHSVVAAEAAILLVHRMTMATAVVLNAVDTAHKVTIADAAHRHATTMVVAVMAEAGAVAVMTALLLVEALVVLQLMIRMDHHAVDMLKIPMVLHLLAVAAVPRMKSLTLTEVVMEADDHLMMGPLLLVVDAAPLVDVLPTMIALATGKPLLSLTLFLCLGALPLILPFLRGPNHSIYSDPFDLLLPC